MRFLAVSVLIALCPQAFADIFPQGDSEYQCQTTGSFFDFSPDGAIASCRKEIDEFCRKEGTSSPTIGRITGHPSGTARYAKAEVNFRCMSDADVALKQQKMAESENQKLRAEIANSKRMCQDDFGFVPNTPEYGNCLLELQKQNFATKRIAQEIAAQKEITEAQLAQQRQSDADQATLNGMQLLNQSLNKIATPVIVPQAQAPAPVRVAPTKTVCSRSGSDVVCTTK
jgi:hypothetical protein